MKVTKITTSHGEALLLEGPPRCGKSLIAQEIVNEKEYVWFDGKQLNIRNRFLFASVTSETKYLVFDDIHQNYLPFLLALLNREKIGCRSKGRAGRLLPLPKFIITIADAI